MRKAKFSLCLIVLLLVTWFMGTANIKASNVIKNMRLSDLVQLGSRWRPYLEATTYDVVGFLMTDVANIGESEQFKQTLLDVWVSFPVAVHTTNPCKERSFRTYSDISDSVKFVRAELLKELWDKSLPTEYDMYLFKGRQTSNEMDNNLPPPTKVCGQINSAFLIPPEYDRSNILYAYSWNISVLVSFKINITITEMLVSYLPLCSTMYSAISDVMPDGRFSLLGIHCPNHPIRSFYSSGHVARVALFTPENFLYLHIFAGIYSISFGELTFLYQVHDNYVYTKSRAFLQMFNVKDMRIGTYLGKQLLKVSSEGGQSGDLHTGTSLDSEFKLQLRHALEVSQFKKVSAGLLYIQAPLGDTISVTSRRSICSSALHSLRFYDGPAIEMLKIDTMQKLLMVWDCNSTNVTDTPSSYSPVNASIGDLTIIRIMDAKIRSFHRLKFGLIWTSIPITDSRINLAKIEVEATGSKSKRFSAEGRPSFLSVAAVSAPRPLSVKINLEAMQYRGHALQHCRSGGLFLFSDGQYIGGICSGATAKYLLEHYGQHGIVLGSKIHIILKQYSYMSEMTATLTFSANTCVGYFNLLPTERFDLGKLYKLTGVQVRRSKVYYDFGYYRHLFSYHHTDLNMWHTLHVTLHSPACVTIQMGLLDHLPADVYNQQLQRVMTVFHLSSAEKNRFLKISYTLFSKEDLSKFWNCRDLFVIDLDTKLERTVLSAIRPNSTTMTKTWQGEAYNIKVGIPNECMGFYTTFAFHIWDAARDSTCVSDVGGFLYDIYYPVLLPGICGKVALISKVLKGEEFPTVIFSFYKPFPHRSCCYFDVAVRPNATGCSNFVVVRERFPQDRHKYLLGTWHLTNRSMYHVNGPFDSQAAEVFTLQVDCQVMLPYDSMARSGVETCTEIHVHLESFLCRGVKVDFHARLFRLHQQSFLRYGEDQREVCIGSSCYVTPSIRQPLAWVDAELACQQRGGVLVSINSEQDWDILTRPHVTENGTSSLVQAIQAQLFYIGLRVQVTNIQTIKSNTTDINVFIF